MAYWNVRIGDEFVLGGARWTVAFPRDTTLYASAGGRDEWTRANVLRPRIDDCHRFSRRRVHRDGRLLTPRPPANPIEIPYGVIATVAPVPANRDRPKTVPHDADAVHVRLTLARQVQGRGIGATYGWSGRTFTSRCRRDRSCRPARRRWTASSPMPQGGLICNGRRRGRTRPGPRPTAIRRGARRRRWRSRSCIRAADACGPSTTRTGSIN